MFGRKGDAWWVRELERTNRAHLEERAAWDKERERLVATVCILAGRSIDPGNPDSIVDLPDRDETWSALDDPGSIGEELHHPNHDDEG